MDHVCSSLRRWYDIWEEQIENELKNGFEENDPYIKKLKQQLKAMDKALDILHAAQ